MNSDDSNAVDGSDSTANAVSDPTKGRTYFNVEKVELADSNDGHDRIVDTWEAENPLGVASILMALEENGELSFPYEIRIMKMTRLDAPLDDEEQEDLDNFIDTLSEQEVDEELVEMEGLEEEVLDEEEWQDGNVPSPEPPEPMRLVPEDGGLWFDHESNKDWSDGYVNIVEVPGDTAGEWPLPDGRTVAEVNPGCSPDEPVVVATYCDGSSKQYAFPMSRLKPTCVECGPVERDAVLGPEGHETCNWCGCHIEGASLE